jgi:hypothetical protein
MLTCLDRPFSQLQRPRKTDWAVSDESDVDSRVYRLLLSLFADNLNVLIKSNRDCLGDLEYHPRIRLSREESHQLEKYVDKLPKEQIRRLAR